mmetsp:Transcript_1836/g.2640  ORF Transcript_1836/g.2640 Transcript_1836/m.2640 type:complete len:672 (+) Transcript_1836:56-2071(+)
MRMNSDPIDSLRKIDHNKEKIITSTSHTDMMMTMTKNDEIASSSKPSLGHSIIRDMGSPTLISRSSTLSSQPLSIVIEEDTNSNSNYNYNNNESTASRTNDNHPKCKNTPITFLFPIFIILNTVTLLDRAIIPGASRTFSSFCRSASDAPESIRASPDYGIGILQSAFVGSYSIATVLVSGHYVHRVRWKSLVLGGLLVWILATAFSGLARIYDSYYILFAARTATGVSEAAFHVLAPPMIQDRGGKRAGMWLSLYLTAVPFGLALGYVYGSYMATSSIWGWEWAFYLEAMFGTFIFFIILFGVRDYTNDGILTSSSSAYHTNIDDYPASSSSSSTNLDISSPNSTEDKIRSTVILTPKSKSSSSTTTTPTTTIHHTQKSIKYEIQACLSSRILLFITFANSAMIAVVATLGTFGGALILALELFENETTAATFFGITAAMAGIIGTPIGGNIVDRIRKQHSVANHDTLKHDTEDDNNNYNHNPNTNNTAQQHIFNLRLLNLKLLSSLLPMINSLITIGSLFAWPTCIVNTPFPFLTLLFFAWCCFFASQSGITMATLLSVDPPHRSSAIAFFTLLSHVLGDVPAPIFFGALKDALAPGCNINIMGQFEDPIACAEQKWGIKATFAAAYAWLGVGTFFFEIARRIVLRQLAALESKMSDGDVEIQPLHLKS